MLGQGAWVLARDRRDDVPGPVRGQLRAQGDRAPRKIAPQPGRPPQDLVGLDVVAPAQLLQERATQVLLDLEARLLDGDLGQTRDRGHVQELEGVAAGASSPRNNTAPSWSSPVAIGTSATTPGGTAAARLRARSPT